MANTKKHAHNFLDLTGQRFGRLVVIELGEPSKSGKIRWKCHCDCGNFCLTSRDNLRGGHTHSCGCFNRDQIHNYFTKHGETVNRNPSPEYRAYCTAKGRCTNPNDHAFDRYGGRGIEFRFESFEQFLNELGRKPSHRHSLDRIDVNGHYEPGNVRWVTDKVQNRNRRNNKNLTYNGVTKTEAEWAKGLGFGKAGGVSLRLKLGWCIACAVTMPAGTKQAETCPHRPKPDRWTARRLNAAKATHS